MQHLTKPKKEVSTLQGVLLERETNQTDLLARVLSDIIEDGGVSSVGDHGSPVGWLPGDGRRKH